MANRKNTKKSDAFVRWEIIELFLVVVHGFSPFYDILLPEGNWWNMSKLHQLFFAIPSGYLT